MDIIPKKSLCTLDVYLNSKSGVDAIYNGAYRVVIDESTSHTLTAQIAYTYLVSQLPLKSPSTIRGTISVGGVVWATQVGAADLHLLGAWGTSAAYGRISQE